VVVLITLKIFFVLAMLVFLVGYDPIQATSATQKVTAA
jgi:hypothetical protein